MKNLLCYESLNINLRLRFVHPYVYSVLLYGCETHTLKVNIFSWLEALRWGYIQDY